MAKSRTAYASSRAKGTVVPPAVPLDPALAGAYADAAAAGVGTTPTTPDAAYADVARLQAGVPTGTPWVAPTPQPTQQLGPPLNPGDGYLYANRNLINSAADDNAQLINGLRDNAVNTGASAQGLLYGQGLYNQQYVDQSNGLANDLRGLAEGSNTQQNTLWQQYAGGLGGLNQRNDAAVGDLEGLTRQLSNPLQSSVTWDGDLTSQAAKADPTAYAAQLRGLSQLSGAASGSLDYQSAAANSYADSGANTRLLNGLSDLRGASTGSRDVRVGQSDPAAYAAAQDAMQKFKDLSDPTVTDKERFLYEQSRMAQEQDERSNRSATLSNLRQRGVLGSGGELTQAALANQQTSQNRLLSDLGANAGAVDRSQQNLQAYGAAALNMNTQGNQIALNNASNQLQALGQYVDASGQLRSATFNEALARNQGTDTANANNQGTRLAGIQGYANQGNTMQQQAFQRGTAADQTAQFNRTQSIDVNKYNSNYAQQERDAQFARQGTLTASQLQGSAQNAANLGNAYGTGAQTIGDNFGRSQTAIGAQDTANTRGNSLANQQTDRSLGAGQQGFQNIATVGQLGIGNNTQRATGLINNNTQLAGSAQAEAARQQALAIAKQQQDAEPGGLFGTGILGKHGLLGLDGVPIL